MAPTISQRLMVGAVLLLAVGMTGWYGARRYANEVAGGGGDCLNCYRVPTMNLARALAAVVATGEARLVEGEEAMVGETRTARVVERPGLPVPPVELPPRQSTHWDRGVEEPVFARFREWVGRWRASGGVGDAQTLARLEEEGVVLARVRQRALGDLIQGDPGRALRLAVPVSLRSEVPGTVAAWLETWVNRRADYNVACALGIPGQRDDVTTIVRWAEWDGVRARVFTQGEALGWVTKRAAPIHGIVLPGDAGTNPPDHSFVRTERLMALSESPVRQLEADEMPEGSGGAVGLEIGGEIQVHPDLEAARAAAAVAVAAADFTQPDGQARGGSAATAAAPLPGTDGPSAATAAADLPTAASARTEGYKRVLFLRVDFPDYPGEAATIPLAEAEALLRDMRSYCLLMSYGRHAIAPVGPGGSAVTPILRMGSNASAYNNEGLSMLYPEARTKAAAAGFILGDYDYDGVFTKSRPSASYAGLAYVGGRGFHMANGYFSKHVTTHEYGHNLGLPHAHRWDTGDESIVGPGTLLEYGNTYDPMGDAYGSIPGEKHYTGSYKNYLDWIPDADAGLVTTSGLYRLTASDFQQSRGRRALRLRKDTRNYWVEFRGGLSGSLLSNSVFVQWGNTDGRRNYLLDTLPGVSGTTLAIGRTFSDPGANSGVGVHVTPVGKGGTFPESMDIQVTIGTPAGNRPPIATVTANTSAAPANTPVVFTATAADPDNDALAYAWDFGNGEFSTDNQPVQTRNFSTAGEYMVQCTVSDMRGATSRAGVIVRIEAPNVFRITGRVLDPAQQPVAGIQLTAVNGSDRKLATTDSSGFYALTGLAARAWTLTAREIVADTLNFTMPFHSRTVTVGPNQIGVDFVASSGPQETVTPLVAKRAVWKWFANGTDPPAGWNQPGFDDASWEEGAGVLGYGNEDGQATTLPFGPSSSAKWTGSFFRRAFELADPTRFPTLRLEVMRDDGVVVHLNGREIFRDNLPNGPVTYSMQAVDATEPNDYLVRNIDVASALPAGLLVAGTNYLTASVHQATSTSSDLAFDAALSGVAPISGVGDALVYLAAPRAEETVASTAPSVRLQANARARAGSVAKVEFFGDGERLGDDTTAPFDFDWPTPAPGRHTAHMVATWSVGGSETSAPVSFTVAPPPATLVPADAVWRYRAENSAAPAGWQQPGFDDNAWAAGPAQLGFGEGDEATVIPSGTTTNRPLTSYFRHTFFVEDPRAVTTLLARLIRDDGALVWLNGIEVIRTNLPASGPISYATLATGAGPNAIDNAEYTFPIDPGALVAGLNVLAVEVHQSDATSSDLSFQLALEARTTAPRPRGLVLTAPGEVAVPLPVELTVEGVAGGTLGLARVEFFADGMSLGVDVAPPFAWTWAAPPVGTHTLTAVATDTGGAPLSSAPVVLTVTPPPAGTALVSFGETWRYLDEGAAPASAWRSLTFDDSGWPQGKARLGYGGDGEATTVAYGQQASSRHITTWFRKNFVVTDPSEFNALVVRLVRDDGAVVSLNGTEILRSNLPAGTIVPTTLASSDVTGGAERAVIATTVPSALLVAGENVLAVEVHQGSPSSSDLGFDLELVGLGVSEDDFRFTTPAIAQSISAAVDLPLTVWAAPALGVTRVEYFAGPAFIGASENAPSFAVTWTTPLVGSYDLSARALAADGGARTAGPLTLTVGEPPASSLHVPAGSTWKYHDAGTLPAANWMATSYADASWKSGAARLGFGADNEATAIQSGRIAYYFRKSFTVASLADVEEVVLRFQRDDGAVVYLNGVEIARDNMPAGPLLPTTLASADASNEQAWIRRVLAPSALQFGTNVLAAEVHQRTANSSDLGWDAELTSRGVNLLAIANTAPASAPIPEFGTLAGPGGIADGWQLAFPETTGRLYLIEMSEDLTEWMPYAYEFAREGHITVRLPSDPTVPQHYYRARWLPSLP